MVRGRPDFTAVMRESTIIPTGTRRSRSAMSSLILTRAPLVQARIQMLANVAMMTTKMKMPIPSSAQRMSVNGLMFI